MYRIPVLTRRLKPAATAVVVVAMVVLLCGCATQKESGTQEIRLELPEVEYVE